MAMIEYKAPGAARAEISKLSARLEERFIAPLRPGTRTWFSVTVAFVLALHAALLGYLVHVDGKQPMRPTKLAETPVEVVVEKPKEKPPPLKKPEPRQPPTKQEIEKPASSAPRAPNEEKVETRELQKETRAPTAATPPRDGRPEPSREESSPPTDPADPAKQDEAAAKKDVLERDAEALDKAKPQPDKKPETKIAKSKPTVKTRRPTKAMRQLAGASTLPDYRFARPTKKSPIHGGTEDSRYLAIVYAKIMSHYRRTAFGPEETGDATVAFEVNDDGSVIGTEVVQSSGDREVDDAAVAAVWRASPMPPSPPGAPHGLLARFSADSEPRP